MINDQFELKIGDFGFAKSSLETLQSLKGTPINMAPEIFKANQKNSEKSYDRKCDIWSLGTILYEMIFGKIIGDKV